MKAYITYTTIVFLILRGNTFKISVYTKKA